VVLEKKTSF